MAEATERTPPRAGPILLVWASSILVLNAGLWLTGVRPTQLATAIDRGAERIETRTRGEVSDDTIRKAIRTQRDTLPFWSTMAGLGDFVLEPLGPALRALAASVLFASLAALVGRPPGFEAAMAANARLQGIWVLGLATTFGLILALRRAEVESSAALFLPPGRYPAAVWLALRQVELFALLGWLASAVGTWRRGQANLAVAVLGCAILMVGEGALRVAGNLLLGAGMRLTILPE